MTPDDYRVTAASYDLVTAPFVACQLTALDALLPLVAASNGPLLDIGCGSGRHLAHALERLPSVEAIGLEPSTAMRSLVLSRLAANPGWRDRVTVRPEGALQAPLPDSLSAVVMLGVLGHFTKPERSELFVRLSRRLPAGAAILLDLQAPAEPTRVTPYLFADTHLGALHYRGFAEGSPLGGEAMQWRMTYQTLDGDDVLDSHTREAVFHHPHHNLVREEMRHQGFTMTSLPDSHWLAVRDS